MKIHWTCSSPMRRIIFVLEMQKQFGDLHFFAKNFCSHFSKESMFWACYETLVLFISGMH
jgi:phage-related protein